MRFNLAAARQHTSSPRHPNLLPSLPLSAPQVVEELRGIDLVSDSERDNLIFVHLDIDETIEVGVWRFRGCC